MVLNRDTSSFGMMGWVAAVFAFVAACNGDDGEGDVADADVDGTLMETDIADATDAAGDSVVMDVSDSTERLDADGTTDSGDVRDARPSDTSEGDAEDGDLGDTSSPGDTTADGTSDGSDGASDTGDASGSGRFQVVSCASVMADEQVQVGPTYQFKPQKITITPGDIVRWSWAATVTLRHNVTADDNTACSTAKPGWFQSSSTAAAGNTFCVKFNTSGTWHYQCTVRNHCGLGMKGTVEVK